mmetsp:Transcript_7395/g.26037  ORF Transcript_7395/g.26037 Transcript_7395/m.26037 type:complete len:139 (-) Transcript_7395:156-572(-)
MAAFAAVSRGAVARTQQPRVHSRSRVGSRVSTGLVAAPLPAVRPLQVLEAGRPTHIESTTEFRRHETDTGSAEVQIASLSARVTQLTEHLAINKKDYDCQRGLKIILGKRQRLLRYLKNTNLSKYRKTIAALDIKDKL